MGRAIRITSRLVPCYKLSHSPSTNSFTTVSVLALPAISAQLLRGYDTSKLELSVIDQTLSLGVVRVYSPPPAHARKTRWFQRPQQWAGLVLVALAVGYGYYTYVETQATEAARQSFEQYLAAEDFENAEQTLATLDSNSPWTKDAKLRLAVARDRAVRYENAKALIDQGDYTQALTLLSELPGYKDADDLANEARYQLVQAAISEENWRVAKMYLDALPQGYRDTDELRPGIANEVTRLAYEEGLAAMQEGDYIAAERLFREAKSAGGEAPADLDDQLAAATELRAQAEAEARLARIREDHKYYTPGDVGIAVGNAYFLSRIGLYDVAQQDHVFVAVYVSVRNQNLAHEHANPHNFRLSTPDGMTVSHHTATYSLNNYFDAVDLNRGQHTEGWIVFHVPKADTYTLHYDSFFASASKQIAPEYED